MAIGFFSINEGKQELQQLIPKVLRHCKLHKFCVIANCCEASDKTENWKTQHFYPTKEFESPFIQATQGFVLDIGLKDERRFSGQSTNAAQSKNIPASTQNPLDKAPKCVHKAASPAMEK